MTPRVGNEANQPFWKTLGYFYQKSDLLLMNFEERTGFHRLSPDLNRFGDAHVSRHQRVINLRRTSPLMMFG